jgi:hypothetical protein
MGAGGVWACAVAAPSVLANANDKVANRRRMIKGEFILGFMAMKDR